MLTVMAGCRPPIALGLLALGACSAAGVPDGPTRAAAEVRRVLPAGTLLVLRGIEPTRPGEVDRLFCDALYATALGQSTRFDVAGPRESPGQPTLGADLIAEIGVQVDPQARVLTSTLHMADGPSLPLTHASYADRPLPAAIDDLAIRTRASLGERDVGQPIPSSLAYSAEPRCVRKTEDGIERLRIGQLPTALKVFEEARRDDSGSPMLLAAFAAGAALAGDVAQAEQLAAEALRYEHRLTPTTRHMLARTLLLSRASRRPQDPATIDRELLQLGEVGVGERPYDPQPHLSRAIALNFLGRFDDSAPLLRQLQLRLPDSATVAYHLGWAELALRRPVAALEAIDRAWYLLPRQTVVVPRALALYEAGEHAELDEMLASLLHDRAVQVGVAQHELIRMQAAHAILTNRPDAAARALLADLEWLRQRPSLLGNLVLDFAEAGEILVLLGRGDDVVPHLRAVQELELGTPALADAVAFLSGMVEIIRSGNRIETAEASLSESGAKSAWSSILRAMGHHAQGELLEEFAALADAGRLTDDPLVKASLVRTLRAMGREAEATQLRETMRREMQTLHLRRSPRHPLLSPVRAMAYVTP